MLVSSFVQEGISSVHQVARHVLVGILDRRESRYTVGRMHTNDEKDFFVSLHEAVQLGHQVSSAFVIFVAFLILLLRFCLVAVHAVIIGHFCFFSGLLFQDFCDEILDGSRPEITVEVGHLGSANNAVIFSLNWFKETPE